MPYSELMDWDDYDLALVREWWRRRALACQDCGTRREEWMTSQGGHPHAYRAEVSQCPGCLKIAVKQDEVASDKDWEHDRALKIALRRGKS